MYIFLGAFNQFTFGSKTSRKMFEKLLVLICLLTLSSANNLTFPSEDRQRQFSLFSIVTFKNEECSAVSTAGLTGVCKTSTECSSTGTADGNCASGFGVCCITKTSTCGGSVSQNCSYIENPSYPSAYTTTGDCSYTVTRCSTEICQVRLDFFKVVLQTAGSTTGSCATTYTTITPGSTGQTKFNIPPALCGTLTGQHLYLDSGRSSSTIATIAFTIVISGNNYWRVKTSQIPCWSASRAPPGCLQYFTGVRSTVTSFSWDGTSGTTGGFLKHQAYRVCFRPEKGMCGMMYTQTDSESSTVDTFELTASKTYSLATDEGCKANGYIEIISDDAQSEDRYCGAYLATASESGDEQTNGSKSPGVIYAAESNPWNFGVYAMSNTAQNKIAGFSIVAQQTPCGATASSGNIDG